MRRRHFVSGTEWEPVVGYSRAIRVGPFVRVSGTTATDAAGNVAGVGDPRVQMVRTLENVRQALEGVGASLADVIRTRIYVTDIEDWEEIGRVHGDVFGSIRPATSMVEVSRLIHPDMLVEVEAEALVVADEGAET
jgi:enamine deaminase RidA (YjgF/YER057c/UK114 family)